MSNAHADMLKPQIHEIDHDPSRRR